MGIGGTYHSMAIIYRRKGDYIKAMQDEIKSVVSYQEDVGLDVLVHGEPERNDMVEYFGEQLDKLYHDITAGKLDATGSFAIHNKAVKDANPKP